MTQSTDDVTVAFSHTSPLGVWFFWSGLFHDSSLFPCASDFLLCRRRRARPPPDRRKGRSQKTQRRQRRALRIREFSKGGCPRALLGKILPCRHALSRF